jgi:glycerol-1-phosphate dehydrogenase [NAD(P)+]
MGQELLERALRAARDTRRLELGSGVLASVPGMFKDLFPRLPALVVADSTTMQVAGNHVAAFLCNSGIPGPEPFVFTDPDLYAEYHFVEELERRMGDAIPVAVGSGTINDLVKLAAHRQGRRYLAVATAASMDGYTAFGASITFNGSKQTFSCPAPAGVVADIEIIRHAPAEMTASGYADLLAKITAGADWVLADALGVEPIHPQAWDLVQTHLRSMVAGPAALRARDPAAVLKLTEGLLMAGFGMQAAQSSRPASGAEHQFSHLWDMQHHTFQGNAPSHGFKVGIGTLAVAALYEYLFQQPFDRLDVERCCDRWPDPATTDSHIRSLLGNGELAEKAIEETRAKEPGRQELRSQLERLRETWPNLNKGLQEQLLPFSTLRQMLSEAGAPSDPAAIGINRKRMHRSFHQAAYIRRRFTVLDLALRTGTLEPGLESLFRPGGVFASKA